MPCASIRCPYSAVPAESLAPGLHVYYIDNTLPKEDEMDFIRKIEARDWIIAVSAFIAGAWIF